MQVMNRCSSLGMTYPKPLRPGLDTISIGQMNAGLLGRPISTSLVMLARITVSKDGLGDGGYHLIASCRPFISVPKTTPCPPRPSRSPTSSGLLDERM